MGMFDVTYCMCFLQMAVNSCVTVVQLSSENQHQSEVHLLPCDIEYDGPAQVAEFFAPTVKEMRPGSFSVNSLLAVWCISDCAPMFVYVCLLSL